jgi:3-oxoacyl-[acyl-carrier protein] reductase
MKTALVTGGSRGIGRAISIKLGELGYNVLVNYRSNDEEAEKTVETIKQNGGSAEKIKFDVADRNNVRYALEKWKKENDGEFIEVLVNNAGIRKDNLLFSMEDSEWDSVIDTNLQSFYSVTGFVIKDMMFNKSGRIINITSLSGIKGLPGQTNYSAAKAGIIGATKALAQEVGRRKITVNAVAPGFIQTEMIEGIEEKEYRKLIPLGRFGKAEEVAGVVAFLISDAANYITGEVISVNGGLYT